MVQELCGGADQGAGQAGRQEHLEGRWAGGSSAQSLSRVAEAAAPYFGGEDKRIVPNYVNMQCFMMVLHNSSTISLPK